MDSSRGKSRPPVFDRVFRLYLASGLLGISSLLLPEPVSAQPSPYLISWLRAHSGASTSPQSSPGILGIGPEVTTPEVPPGSVIVLPGGTSHFHWARSGEYVSQVSAIGPLGLDYVDPHDDPRTRKE